MTDPTKTKPLTAADAAKAVKRPVAKFTKDDDGKVIASTTLVPVKADEVLAFRDYGTHIVVVTKDGQKFSSADLAAEKAAG